MAEDRVAHARGYIERLTSVLSAMPFDDISVAIEILDEARRDDRQVFLAGNGGSAATASHMANDLLKTVTKTGGRGLRALALTDNVPLLTAIGNDLSYDAIFSAQLERLARPGDVLVVITGSGRSMNIVEAVRTAREMGVRTVGFLGMGGGVIGSMVDVAIVVPSDDYGPIEDVHMVLDHLVTDWMLHKP